MGVGSEVSVLLVVPMGPRVEEEELELSVVVSVRLEVSTVPLEAAVPPVLTGPKDEVELAYGGVDDDELPPAPVLRGSNELTLVRVERTPLVPVEIGPTVLVEFVLVVDGPLEELENQGGKVKVYGYE